MNTAPLRADTTLSRCIWHSIWDKSCTGSLTLESTPEAYLSHVGKLGRFGGERRKRLSPGEADKEFKQYMEKVQASSNTDDNKAALLGLADAAQNLYKYEVFDRRAPFHEFMEDLDHDPRPRVSASGHSKQSTSVAPQVQFTDDEHGRSSGALKASAANAGFGTLTPMDRRERLIRASRVRAPCIMPGV